MHFFKRHAVVQVAPRLGEDGLGPHVGTQPLARRHHQRLQASGVQRHALASVKHMDRCLGGGWHVPLPGALLRAPGGEADWNVAEAVGHVADSRAGLALAAAKAASGAWPSGAPPVVPGIPGSPDADRTALLHRIERSQRIIERAARTVSGHETDPCPLEHPLVGRLRCGEWLLFAGVHDVMHLEQLHDLAEGAR